MRIALLSAIDRRFRDPLAVLVASLLRAKQVATTVEWHVFVHGIDDDWNAWVDELHARHEPQNATFVLHRLEPVAQFTAGLSTPARRIKAARLFAPELLASRLPRLLYLDADMLVLQPIEELWTTELGRHACACSQDIAIPNGGQRRTLRTRRSTI